MVTYTSNEIIWDGDNWRIYHDSTDDGIVIDYMMDDTRYVFTLDGAMHVDNLEADHLELNGNVETETVTADNFIVSDLLNIPTYPDDDQPPSETLYFNTDDGRLKYKDADGNIRTPEEYTVSEDQPLVTSDTTSLAGATEHADLTDDQLHSPAEHGDDAHTYHDRFNFSQSHTLWEDGLNEEEIFRYECEPGESFSLDRIEFQQKHGGQNSNAHIDLYDEDTGSVIDTAELGEVNTSTATSSDGATVLVRATNGTGSAIEANLTISGRIA